RIESPWQSRPAGRHRLPLRLATPRRDVTFAVVEGTRRDRHYAEQSPLAAAPPLRATPPPPPVPPPSPPPSRAAARPPRAAVRAAASPSAGCRRRARPAT